MKVRRDRFPTPGTAVLSMLLACAAALCGCRSIGGLSGAAAGVASGSAIGPAAGVAIGIAVESGVDASVKAVRRRWSAEDQTRMAMMVGDMAIGESRPWQTRHFMTLGDEQGHVTLVRVFESSLAPCREAIFSVEDPKATQAGTPEQHFVTTMCKSADGWRWAAAEPAVGRWGALQ
jgi:hypothetical protein